MFDFCMNEQEFRKKFQQIMYMNVIIIGLTRLTSTNRIKA